MQPWRVDPDGSKRCCVAALPSERRLRAGSLRRHQPRGPNDQVSAPWFLIIITPSSGPSTVTTSRERAACCRAELPLLHFRHISCTRLGTTSRHRPEVAPGKSSTIRCTSRFRGSGGPARIRAKPPRLHVAACRPGAWPSPASRRLARPRHTGEDPQVNRFSWVPARRSPRRLEARRARAWTRARCERC